RRRAVLQVGVEAVGRSGHPEIQLGGGHERPATPDRQVELPAEKGVIRVEVVADAETDGGSRRTDERLPAPGASLRVGGRRRGRTRSRTPRPLRGGDHPPDRRQPGHGKRETQCSETAPFPVSHFPFPAPRSATPLTPPPRTSLSARRSRRPTASPSLDQTRFPSGHEAPPHGGTGRRPDPPLRRPCPLPPDREGVLSGSPAAHRL